VNAVTFEQKRVGLGGRKVIDRYQLKIMVIALQNGACDQATNAAKSVNCYLYSHVCSNQPKRATI
jgi:hypothetical protein